MADINCTLQGSEEIYETCCSPCLEVGKTKEARTFCADCGSHLCEKCVRDHNKFVALRSHRLTDMCNQESKGECEGKRTAVTSVQIARCATHRGKLLDMYCEDHSQFCCPSCVTVKHRSCKNVDSLSNVAKRFKDSDQHKEIKEVIENIKIKAVAERKKRKEYLASLDSEKNKLLQDVEKYHDDIINKVKELTETTRRKILSRHKEYQKPVELDNIALETVISTMNSYSEKQMDPNVEQLFLDAQAGKVAAKEGEWLIDDLPTDWEKTIPFCFNLELKQKLDSSEALGEMTDAVKEVCEFSKCTDVLHKVLEGCDKSSLLHAFLHLYLMPSPNTGLESDRHSTCELQGFLKRTYQCKECHHNSESTKPFYHLPIPVMQLHKLLKKQMRQLTLFWVPYSAREKPIQFKLLLAKNSVVADLCDELSGYVKVDTNHMVVTDVYNHRFHKVFAMSDAVRQIMDRDDIFIYEVPANYNSDMIMLPIYMREKRERFPYFKLITVNLFYVW
ncbi:E3 ubiquitin-protein ligase TRIM33-like [Mercenaria mercenaria]|uniref:E3 ubiquitin-protein ligase TRIM33-like n=1 Tax=Mercenaria mercenaria TaxID=6596 RepID=UPI00234EEBB8|nr:E3 ubiquitin-protein ligase TRIM33-like [Mercenaria mercenaria]